jgi:AcrR family transcriptional regulator
MLNDMQRTNDTDLYDSCYPPPNMKTPVKPKDRILDVADELFYGRGIHAVGVDEIVARSGAAKTTLYAHFTSKDQLVASYLQRRSEGWRVYLQHALDQTGGSAAARIDRVFELLTEGCASPTFRGCPFINAAAEFPDPHHPARVVAAAHRAWLRQLFTDLAIEAEASDPDTLAVWLCMLYDATMITAHLNPGEDAASKSRDAVRILVQTSLKP